MNNPSNNERFRRFVDYLKYDGVIGNDAEFANNIGKKRSFVSEILSGKRPITDSFASHVGEIYSLLNKDWLMTGEGEMIKKTEPISTPANEVSGITMIPMLPIAAQGGSLNDFIVSLKTEDCEKIVSPIKGVDFAISVSGDSMEPEYPNGSKILIKKINEKAFIEWGRVYVLDTCNGTVIKKIMPGKTAEAVACVSLNTNYPPFEVEFADMYGMYRVLMLLSEK